MIDENKLLREIEKQIIFLDGLAIELAEAGDIKNMDICDGKAMMLREVVNFINELQNMTDDMEKNSQKENLKKIAGHYGLQAQKGMLIEEMAELMQAVNKYDRNPSYKNLENLTEEIADVEIMRTQAKYLYGIMQENIDKIKDKKIQRTLERMKNENN